MGCGDAADPPEPLDASDDGQFYRLHNLAIDSRGNLYTTEVNVGHRVQKFDRLGR